MFMLLVGVLLLTAPNPLALAEHLETCDSESEECAHTSLLQTALSVGSPQASSLQTAVAARPSILIRNNSTAATADLGRGLHTHKPTTAAMTRAGIESFIKRQMIRGRIPGMSAVVLHKDKVLWDGHYGSTDPQDPKAPSVRNDTFFQFASLSKTLIGMSAMVMYEKGLLNPDDDVNTHLPFRLRNPNFPDTPITVHGLLTHTSSMVDEKYVDILPKVFAAGDPKMSLEKFFEAMLSTDGKWYSEKKTFLKKKPQTHHIYCNVCAALAAYIVEIVAKKKGLASDYDEYVKSAVLAPLGIKHAGYFQRDLGGKAKMAPPAGARPSSRDFARGKNAYKSHDFFSYPDYPDGTFKASALDYARVFGAFINDGNFQGVQLLKPETVKYMKKVAGKPCWPEPCGDSMSCWLQTNSIFLYWDMFGRVMLGHNALDKGVMGSAFYNYDSGVGYVVLSNGDDMNSVDTISAFEAITKEIMNTFDTPDKQFRPDSHADLDKRYQETDTGNQDGAAKPKDLDTHA